MKSSSNIIRGASPEVKLAAWLPVTLGSQQDESSQPPVNLARPASAGRKQVSTLEHQSPIGQAVMNQAAVSISQPLSAGITGRLLAGQEAVQQVAAWVPQEFVLQPTGKVRTAEDNAASMADLQQMRNELLRTTMERAERDAHQQAEKILGEAKRDAGQILEDATQQAQQMIAQADAGAGQVSQQAYQDGMQAVHSEAAGMLQMAQALVDEVRQWKEHVLAQSEPMVIGLVQDIAQKLFGQGFVLDAESLGKTFERSLAEAKNLGHVRIRAHPEDVALLDSLWSVHQTAVTGQKIELIPNQDIERGGCFIEGEYGTVDARVKTQLRLITETLGDVMASETQGSDPFTPYEKDSGDQ